VSGPADLPSPHTTAPNSAPRPSFVLSATRSSATESHPVALVSRKSRFAATQEISNRPRPDINGFLEIFEKATAASRDNDPVPRGRDSNRAHPPDPRYGKLPTERNHSHSQPSPKSVDWRLVPSSLQRQYPNYLKLLERSLPISRSSARVSYHPVVRGNQRTFVTDKVRFTRTR